MWKTFINNILEIFFEKQCVFCKRKGEFLCDDCFSLIEVLEKQYPVNNSLDELVCACSKENKFITRVLSKYINAPFLKELAIPLTKLLTRHISFINKDFKNFVILPIKKHNKKNIGYDPNYEMALLLSYCLSIPLIKEYKDEENVLLFSDVSDDLLNKKAVILRNNGAKYIAGITILR